MFRIQTFFALWLFLTIVFILMVSYILYDKDMANWGYTIRAIIIISPVIISFIAAILIDD